MSSNASSRRHGAASFGLGGRPARRAIACLFASVLPALIASGCTAMLSFASANAHAQSEPPPAIVESPAVAARFPDPAVRYATPSLASDRPSFPTHSEMHRFSEVLAARSKRVHSTNIGRSQQGRAIQLVVVTQGGMVDTALPTALFIGQQHGDEPAAGDAALAIAERLATTETALLDHVNVVLLPRANPDAVDMFRRASANGVDVDRDGLLLRSPEARIIADVLARFRPQVIVDMHEFAAAGPATGTMARYDADIHAATVPATDAELARIGRTDFVDVARKALVDAGFAVSPVTLSHETIPAAAGGPPPADALVDINALRPAISLRVDVRGAGLGRAHLLRRVHTHVVAGMAIVSSAARMGPSLVRSSQAAAQRLAADACNGSIAIDADARIPASRQSIEVLDAQSGEIRTVDVDVPSPRSDFRMRARPCGYLLSAAEAAAVGNLQKLGVKMERVRARSTWAVERYSTAPEAAGKRRAPQRETTSGTASDNAGLHLAKARFSAKDEWFYVPLDQPYAALVSTALEPDSRNGFAVHGMLDSAKLLRVTRKPTPNMLAAPPKKPTVRATRGN